MGKKYYWNWKTSGFMDEDIDLFLEVSKKQNNVWWKNLISTPFLKKHLEYFKDVASNYFMTGEVTEIESLSTAKTCPAIANGLLDKIIILKLPCDVFISVNEHGSIYWNIKEPSKINITTHQTDQFYSAKENPFYNKVNVKFELPIVFSSSKDTYMFLQPQFHKQNYPFEVVLGSVSKDRILLNINTFMEIPKEQNEYYLKKGTIISYMWFDNNNIVLEKNDKLTYTGVHKFFGNKG